MKWKCYVMLISFVFLGSLFEGEGNASYCDENTYVFFGNGMSNDQSDAKTSIDRLEVKLRPSMSIPGGQWVFDVSYNHHEGAASLLEVYRQRMNDQTASFWRWLGSVENAPDWFQETAQTLANGYDLHEAIIDEDLQEHIQRYESLLLKGDRILVVAHSQGNLYANAAYTNLDEKGLPMDSFGIVSVATPASRVAGDGPYFTLVNDVIIGGVRLFFPNTLEPNVANIPTLVDWSQHSFVESYLNGDQSGPLILNSVLSEANALAWPEPEVGKGLVSVTLTWGEQPDLDLHIFEPAINGHVYYANPVGQYGDLDRDDVSGFGPEHYYIKSCEQLEPGVYGVGVNYYRGDGFETAKVQIQAGDKIRNYTAPMIVPLGSAGNTRAWPVADIEVIEDEENGISFEVRSAWN